MLEPDGRFVVAGDDLLHCDGATAPLTNIYPAENLAADWQDWRAGDGGLSGPEQMSSLIFETRSPAWVAEVGLLLAEGLETQAWFVDAADVVWPVGKVDSEQIALS
ncbi:hypothetical protein F4692_003302 [Nocardioides cavernae]|uniref:Uncharacterized protein n=1 Tax=Nocardioides cavernae TaxID=1921566 RepID=A0A7Y9KU19_9ACTN|nr:hypothetical protein [Nocardioides cavernae]NYE38157.1 hypothetical protein [Nocardioides cavernae]